MATGRGWEFTLPTFGSPTAAGLILPELGPEIPAALNITAVTRPIAELADALRKERILRPDDWTGDLVSTIEQGLQHWYARESGPCRFIDLDLLYTDDTNGDQGDESGYYSLMEYSGHWAQSFGYDSGALVGMFALGCGDPEYGMETYGMEVFVGDRVTELNALVKGLGYSVFGLVQKALRRTVQSACPDWGASVLDYTGGFRSIEPEDEEIIGPPLKGYKFGSPRYSEKQYELFREHAVKRFRRGFPRGIWTAKWRPELVRRALRRQPRAELRELLEEALVLGELWQSVTGATEDRLKQLNEWDYWNNQSEELVHPVILRWDRGDLLPRVYDEYIQCAQENAGFTTIVYKRGFRNDDPKSIHTCLKGLKTTLEIIRRADRILQFLHTESRAEVQIQVPTRVEVRI